MPPPLETLRRQYFALVPPYLLHIPPPQLLAESQEWLVSNLITTRYPPESSYRRQFWRKLLPQIEAGIPDGDEDQVVNEEIYEEVSSLMALPTQLHPPPSFKTFIYDSGSITLLEEQVAIQAGTTGLRTWTAALHLGHHLLRGLIPVGKAIELGAGTGFLSILWAQMGGDVIATDLDGGDMAPLSRMKANIELNETGGRCRPLALDWGDVESWDTEIRDGSRVVLAADVIYDPEIVPLLVGAIAALIPESYAIIAATVRNEETFQLFLDTCASRGLRTELLQLEPVDQDSPTFWDTALDLGTRVEIVRVKPP